MKPPDGPFAVLLGAGWGCAVGLPGSEQPHVAPGACSEGGRPPPYGKRARGVRRMVGGKPRAESEQFLTAVFERKVTIPVTGEQIAMEFADIETAGWRAAVEFVALRIATSVDPARLASRPK